MGSSTQIVDHGHGFQGNVTWALLATLALQKSCGQRALLVSACQVCLGVSLQQGLKMPSLLCQAGHEDPPTALWWGNALPGPPLELCKAVSHPQEGHIRASVRLSILPPGPDAPSLPPASVPDVQRARLSPLLGSGVVLQGSISTAIAMHSPSYLAAFQANGDSSHRLQIKVQLLPNSKLCLLPCTAPLAWPQLSQLGSGSRSEKSSIS